MNIRKHVVFGAVVAALVAGGIYVATRFARPESPDPPQIARLDPDEERRIVESAGVGAIAQRALESAKERRIVESAKQALLVGNFEAAERAANRVLSSNKSSGIALTIAGIAAQEQRKFQAALDYYSRIPETDRKLAATGQCNSGKILSVELGKLAAAERHFRRALKLDPSNACANGDLSNLLGMTGRSWESLPFVVKSLKRAVPSIDDLEFLASPHDVLFKAVAVNLERCRKAAPDDPLPLLGQAAEAIDRKQYQRAKSLLTKVLAMAPELLEAHARMGHVLVELDLINQLKSWHAKLPANADSHPEIWIVRGRWSQANGQHRAEVRCYLEALRRRPDHDLATYRLSVLLNELNRKKLAARFADRAKKTTDFAQTVSDMRKQRNVAVGQRKMRKVAELADQLGRLWESRGWCQLTLKQDPNSAWAKQLLQNLEKRLKPETPQVLPSAQPAYGVTLSEWPLPHRFDRPISGAPAPKVADLPTPRFEWTGFNFRYFNGADPQRKGAFMYQANGGGAGVLDFDRDGRPDVYFTQGCRWPPKERDDRYLDGLFRNSGDGRFENVAAAAGIFENRFGQGVTIGDYDGDGFPDVFVANIGENRLYHNLGDGTFEDVTEQAGIAGARWTTSCVIADLNGDSLPDIYAVHYVKAPDVFSRLCGQPPGMCGPKDFQAEQDRLYVNLGDGRFRDVTQQAGIVVPRGKGLGILVADFDRSRKLGILVANDTESNFLFNRTTQSRDGTPKFQERAAISGLATDWRGINTGCMGIAADDCDGNGRLDLFVTNFASEANCLYLQQSQLAFSDSASRARLRNSSVPMVGWGTQFLDAELDGRMDLVVTNGHIDDRSFPSDPFQMSAQYFRGHGNGRFAPLTGDKIGGSFFSKKWVGRGLARLDWNRDGREDFVVSHINQPAALVTNTTKNVGHHLSISLVAVQSDRDAIGTVVTAKVGNRVITKQLTAGDGFFASNQRQIVFGLGANTTVEELTVHWPSGQQKTWKAIAVDRELLLIEGRDDPIRLR